MYYTQEQIDRANQANLVSFLQGQGEQLTRAGQEYRWKRHDSLTIRGNKWYRHSQSKGGAPIDFVMEFFGKSFTEAVELLTGEKGAAPPPDRPSPASLDVYKRQVHERDKKRAKQAIQHIGIYFNHIGRFENELTQLAEPTEQEIQRLRGIVRSLYENLVQGCLLYTSRCV